MCVLPYLSFPLLVWFFCPFLACWVFVLWKDLHDASAICYYFFYNQSDTIHLNSWSWSDVTWFLVLVCHCHWLHLCCCMLNSDAFLYPVYFTCLHIVYIHSLSNEIKLIYDWLEFIAHKKKKKFVFVLKKAFVSFRALHIAVSVVISHEVILTLCVFQGSQTKEETKKENKANPLPSTQSCSVALFLFYQFLKWLPLMPPCCLESQCCHLISFSCVLSCFSACSSCCFCPLFSYIHIVFLCVLMDYSPDFFYSSTEILKQFLLIVGPVCMALVEQLGDGRWYVQLAAIWHWYLPLCNSIQFKNILGCFCPFPFIFFFNLVSVI